MPAGGDSFGGCGGSFGGNTMDSGGGYSGGHDGYNSNGGYSVSFTSIPGYNEGFYDGVLHIGTRAEFTREYSHHDNNPMELGITSDDFLNSYSQSLDSIKNYEVSNGLQSKEFEISLRSASDGLERYDTNVLNALSKLEALYNEYIKLYIEHKNAMEYYNGNIHSYPGHSNNLMRSLDVSLVSIPAAKNEILKTIEEQKVKEEKLKETEEKLLKEIFKEDYSDIKLNKQELAKIKNDIDCVDIHRVLDGNPDMQYMSVKLYQSLTTNKFSENEALAILGNSLIEIHDNPFATPQKVNHILALEGAGLLAYKCTTNPTCVNLVASSLAAAWATGKIQTEGFDVAEEIDTTLSTPEQKHKSQDEEFLADTTVNNIPGFDWEQYVNNDEGFVIPEGIDTSILTKTDAKIDRNNEEQMKDAYSEAMNGGKHSSWAKQYIDKPTKEIEKGIKSFEKQIELHEDKIKNPAKHNDGWESFRSERKEALLQRWPKDIQRHKEQKAILEEILKNRGK